MNIRFKPSFLSIAVTIVCIPLFIHLGNWQYNKAMQKQALQNQFDIAALHSEPTELPLTLNDYAPLKYKLVKVYGHFEPKFSFLLDNMVYEDRVGFYVMTPFRIEKTKQLVLVNRGWLQALKIHADLPVIETPADIQTIIAKVMIPSNQFFSLENTQQAIDKNEKIWPVVWQNLDMKKLSQLSSVSWLPLVLRLEPNSTGSNYVRDWPAPVENIVKNIGYAYQWYGFAAATLAIFLFTSIKRKTSDNA